MYALTLIIIFFASIYGWVANLVKIFSLLGDPITAELLIRVVGVPVAIIGIIAGYF